MKTCEMNDCKNEATMGTFCANHFTSALFLKQVDKNTTVMLWLLLSLIISAMGVTWVIFR